MNEDRKKRGVVEKTRLTSIFIVGLFLLGNSTLLAHEPTSEITYGISEQQQTISVSGVVLDNLKEPVIGASVIEKGTSNGTITDINGRFSLTIRQGASLLISFVGYQTQEIRATPNMTITLKEDSELLDEVVVVGYGTQKKANLTGAVSTVDVSKTLEARPQSDVSRALQGVVPGLTILNSSGTLDTKPSISIRGTGTLSNDAKSDPLIVVDGVPMEDISYLNPQDIENISVLKDAASTSIYGTRAAFGVILITTKAAKKTDRVTVSYNNNFAWETPTILPNFPDVPTQLRAMIEASDRGSGDSDLFGMQFKDLLPHAEAWRDRNNGKKAKYREAILGEDFDIVDGKGLYYADWDVVGIMFRDWKPSQSHNVTIQGTSGKTSYYLSLGYNHEEGVLNFNPDKLDRYTANFNLTSDITDWLQIGARFNYTDRTYTSPNTRRATYTYMWRWGSFFGPYGTYEGQDFRTDIPYLKQAGDDKRENTYTRMGGFAKAKITKGLTVNVDYTFNLLNSLRRWEALPVVSWNSWGSLNELYTDGTSTSMRHTSGRDRSYAFNAYANYEFSVAKKHNFNVMLGANAEEGEYTSHWSNRLDLLDNNMPEFNLAVGDPTVGGSHSEWGTAGWFGRINYNYNGIWLAELNGRYDGSSKFPENDRWAFFPSGSVGYRISEEAYFEPVKKIVNNAKLRASYGEIGNQAVGNNMYISTLTKTADGSVNWLDGSGNKVVIYGIPSLVSSTLSWERIRTLDIGGDFGFLNNDLNVSFDWYQRDTKEMLAPGQTMPQVLGANAPYVNAGSLRTRGWELSIDWRHRFKNNLTLYANASIGDFKTTVTKWDNETMLLNQNYTGKVVGEIWGFETDRLYTKDDFVYNSDGTLQTAWIDPKNNTVHDNQIDGGILVNKLKDPKAAYQYLLQGGNFIVGPGDIKYKDLDGDGFITGGDGTRDSHGDLKVIGNTTPRYQYSFRLGGEWKGIDIDLFFQGIGKRQVWTQSAFVMPMMRGVDALYANQTNYWSEENQDPNAEFPRMYAGGAGKGNISVLENGKFNFYPQSKYLVNMAYLRFKNLTVGYTFPKEWTRKVYMEKARVYFSANNICELINKSRAPIDPEINTSQGTQVSTTNDYGNGTWGRVDPLYRTVSFGLQVTF